MAAQPCTGGRLLGSLYGSQAWAFQDQLAVAGLRGFQAA